MYAFKICIYGFERHPQIPSEVFYQLTRFSLALAITECMLTLLLACGINEKHHTSLVLTDFLNIKGRCL